MTVRPNVASRPYACVVCNLCTVPAAMSLNIGLTVVAVSNHQLKSKANINPKPTHNCRQYPYSNLYDNINRISENWPVVQFVLTCHYTT